MTRSLAALVFAGVLAAGCAGGDVPESSDAGDAGDVEDAAAVEGDTPSDDAPSDDAPVDDADGGGSGPAQGDGDGSAAGSDEEGGVAPENSGLQRGGGAASSSLTAGGGIEVPPLDQRAFELFTELDAASSEAGAVVEVDGDVLFDFDDDRLRPEADPVIADLVELAARTGEVPIEVVGHTDGFGSDSYNLDLSRRRAEAVVAALAAQGVDPDRLESSGVGSTEPLVDEVGADGQDDAAARARNRRVEVTFEGIDLQDPSA